MNKLVTLFAVSLIILGNLTGCASKQTFSTSGRPGETVSLHVGWFPDLKRENLTVSIQPCVGDLQANASTILTNVLCTQNSGPPIVYTVANPELRAVVNLYPDPVSKLVYNKETGATNPLADSIEFFATQNDKEYLQTMVVLDVPDTMPVNSQVASISMTDAAGANLQRQFMEVHQIPYYLTDFANWDNTALSNTQFREFERQNYKTVTFSGPTVPYAVQVDLTHNPGTFYVVNPRGDVKNLSWSDNGSRLRVMLMPTWNKGATPAAGETLGEFVHFKFYVAGDVDTGGLAIPAASVQGFDINGNPVANVTATLQ